MRKMLLAATVIAAALVSGAPQASAQTVCGERTGLIERLDKVYGEAPVGIGLGLRGKVYELLTAPNGSWTILATLPNGVSCIVAAGEAWQTIEVKVKEPLA